MWEIVGARPGIATGAFAPESHEKPMSSSIICRSTLYSPLSPKLCSTGTMSFVGIVVWLDHVNEFRRNA